MLRKSFDAGSRSFRSQRADRIDARSPSPRPTPRRHRRPRRPHRARPTRAPTRLRSRRCDRSEVHRVVAGGLGAFLSRVSLDDHPAKAPDGKFVGFRINSLQGNSWKGVDLKPGDVVTKVNGFPIERPEQALEVFQSLDVASELARRRRTRRRSARASLRDRRST